MHQSGIIGSHVLHVILHLRKVVHSSSCFCVYFLQNYKMGISHIATLALAASSVIGIAVAQTDGCGKTAPQKTGSSTEVSFSIEGTSRKYRIYVPASYDQSSPTPVVFSFHGWGETASFNENYMGLTNVARDNNFIVVYPEGMADYQRENNNGWQSLNGGGTTETLGNECTSSTTGYCYLSCQRRPQGCGRCDWTSCYDDVEFVEEILNSVETSYCVDKKRIHATGYSNGGIFTYTVGNRLGNRFASIVPGGGTPHSGHNNAPAVSRDGAVSVMDLHGITDRTCPANSTTSSDGWNYTPVDDVLKVWGSAHGCTSMSTVKHFTTPEDGQTKLWCGTLGNCPGGVDMVRCSYQSGHEWLGYCGCVFHVMRCYFALITLRRVVN